MEDVWIDCREEEEAGSEEEEEEEKGILEELEGGFWTCGFRIANISL